MISSVPAMNYPFKVSNWSTKIRCENCSKLRMKTLHWYQWRHSSVFIVCIVFTLLSLLLASTNKSPEVISGYFVNFVQTVQGIVITSRTDRFGWQLQMHKIDFVVLFHRNIKGACRVVIWKKTFFQNSDKFGYSVV